MSLVVRALGQAILKLALVASGLWREIATAVNALPAGLGVNLSYRPARTIPPPAFQALFAVGYVRELLAAASRAVARVAGAGQRAAYRADAFLVERRKPGETAAGEELPG